MRIHRITSIVAVLVCASMTLESRAANNPILNTCSAFLESIAYYPIDSRFKNRAATNSDPQRVATEVARAYERAEDDKTHMLYVRARALLYLANSPFASKNIDYNLEIYKTLKENVELHVIESRLLVLQLLGDARYREEMLPHFIDPLNESASFDAFVILRNTDNSFIKKYLQENPDLKASLERKQRVQKSEPSPKAPKRPSVQEFHQKPVQTFNAFVEWLNQQKEVVPLQKKLTGVLTVLQKMLFMKTSQDYLSGSLSGSNAGLKNYFTKVLSEDDQLLAQSLSFYSQLEKKFRLADRAAAESDPITLFDKTNENIWELALKSTDGDPLQAIRVLSILGHDDVAREIRVDDYPEKIEFRVLNSLYPMPQSVFYMPGSLEGLNVSPELLKRFERMRVRMDEIDKMKVRIGSDPFTAEQKKVFFRAAYYHFIGGALITAELVRHGYGNIGGIKLPVFISDRLGYFYKKITMESDYLVHYPDALELYKNGYKTFEQRFKKPEAWSEERYQIAKFHLDLNLLHLELTTEQHRKGAEWAFDKLVMKP